LHGKIFTLYKLKTLENDIIISPYAHWLRKTGLDEFPQLFNILIGQMSFVGPRPLLPSYLPLYTPHQFTRHNVLPGITGWAQVHGRNATTWNNRFELDIWYAKNQSFLIDIQIIILTFKQLFYGQNTNEMPIWKGN
jgi:lipopolysaccharide/colanic/teichoic acid biosynthesis glycosyltransferase